MIQGLGVGNTVHDEMRNEKQHKPLICFFIEED